MLGDYIYIYIYIDLYYNKYYTILLFSIKYIEQNRLSINQLPPRLIKAGMLLTLDVKFSLSSARLLQLMSNSNITGGT